jgi:ubiquitin-conjugating enzyme E2 O
LSYTVSITKCDVAGLEIMDLFAIDSDSESYTGTSDSEDQECEFAYGDHAQNILSSLDESIGKIDNFLTFERGFLHGDIVCPVSDPSGQLGRVVGVSMLVDLETSSGDIIKDVNSKKLSRVRSFVSGDRVVMGPWIGRVIRAFDLVTLLFSDGAKCEILLRDLDVLKPVPPIIFEDAPYFYYPGQRVRIVDPSVSKSATWLCGSWRPSRDNCIVSHVDVGRVHVNWITSVTNVWGDKSSSPPNIQDPKKLTLLSCFPYANWQLGDWCALMADNNGCLWMDSGKSCILSEDHKCESHGHMYFESYGSDCSQTYVVAKTKSTVDVLWQNGTVSLGLEPQALVPVSTLGDHDFWPGQYVLEKLTVEDAARCQRTAIVRDVDALERTVNVKWIGPAHSDTVSYGSDPVETVSVYELVEHPDFSFCTGEVVIRSAVNIDKSEADLTNGSLASKESLVTSSGFLSCIGNVLGYKDNGIEVQWANGVISKVT